MERTVDLSGLVARLSARVVGARDLGEGIFARGATGQALVGKEDLHAIRTRLVVEQAAHGRRELGPCFGVRSDGRGHEWDQQARQNEEKTKSGHTNLRCARS